MIKKAFQVHGPVESVKRVEGKSCAFVTFQFIEHAVIARKALNNSRLGGGIIKTGFAKVPFVCVFLYSNYLTQINVHT